MTNYLAHHGISGQKRGVRRYQLANGTYTEEGNKRYRKKKEKPEKPEKPSAPGRTEETIIVTNSKPKTTEYNEAEEPLKRTLSVFNVSNYLKKGTEAFANSKFSQGMNKTATEAFSSFKTTTKKTASKIVEAITTNVNSIKKLFNK